MWFLYALACILLWGAADLFYKKGAVEGDGYGHLKTSVAVGFVMGAHATAMLIFGGVDYAPVNLIVYLPVSLMYILSMTIGYLGLRYLELSISSPVQNTSGALVSVMCLVFLGQRMDILSSFGVVIICVGVFSLGLFEARGAETIADADQKYKRGLGAFALPLLYCLFDALGTFFDVYYLDDWTATPLVRVTERSLETVANTSYELTFFIVAILLFIYVRFVKKSRFRPANQKNRLAAALLETAGQFAYVYAMSGNGAVAAPMVASYSIVSVLLSRVFLKERLAKKQYAVVGAVIFGIVLLGVAEGLAG